MLSESRLQVPAAIVNRNGAKGCLTLTSDDGDPRTSDFFYTVMAPRYPAFRIAVAVPTRKIASLSLTPDGSAWQMDENGKYALTVLENTYRSEIPDSVFRDPRQYPTTVDFWRKILTCDSIELASHSHTHAAWGLTDERNGDYPAGNVIKELHASAQIMRDLLNEPTPFIMRPGGHSDLTSDYFFDLVGRDTTYLGMRGGSGPAPWRVPAEITYNNKMNTLGRFREPRGRLRIASIDVRSYEAAFNEEGNGFSTEVGASAEECIRAGVSAWTNYVDLAMQNGDWASIGFHGVVPDTAEPQRGYAIYDSQMTALMDYVQPLVQSGELWVPDRFAEAAKYYYEWSSASLEAWGIGDERIEVTLTDQEDARFDEKLTVKVTVPSTWREAILHANGESERLSVKTDTDGTRFVYANLLPNRGTALLSPLE